VIGRTAHLVATTKESGWFALCDVPSPGTMTLVANRGADSTDVLELQLTADGFLRRELYIGAARAETQSRTDSTAASRRMHVGEGRLSGTVHTKVGNQPVVGAQVGIFNGPQTRTNAQGEWTLANAPAGTRMLEVRAVSYYPERRPVDIVADAAPVHISLSTLKAVLDTVRVVAKRGRFEEFRGFDQRRHMGMGHYITRDQITRRNPLVISDMLRMISGVRIDRSQLDSTSLQVRAAVDVRPMTAIVIDTIGTFAGGTVQGSGDWCSPAIFIDGRLLRGLSVHDLDEWIRPEDVVGIEVYSGISAPAQYQAALHGCGSIVIWTR
ncbi:MAG TPA: carboxypeptidase regulatory-like domain-containing protein, partial [Gemmatimonadaceae bacterium]